MPQGAHCTGVTGNGGWVVVVDDGTVGLRCTAGSGPAGVDRVGVEATLTQPARVRVRVVIRAIRPTGGGARIGSSLQPVTRPV